MNRHLSKGLNGRWSIAAVIASVAICDFPAAAQTNEELMGMIKSLKQQILELKEKVRANEEAAKNAAKSDTPENPHAVVRSGKKQIELTISGQVNRAALIYDDGDNGDVLFVDNDNSSTRLRARGKGTLGENWSAGTNFEVQFESNSTQNVNQIDERNAGVDNFTQRKLEVWFDHRQLGRVWLGQGDSASNKTAEKDLSGTGVVGSSDVDDSAGGLFFHDDDSGLLACTIAGAKECDGIERIRIRDAFTNLDGLGRDDRIRYDTPKFHGLKLSVSALADSQWDVAAHFAKQYEKLKFEAGLGFADQNAFSKGERISGSFSALHLPTGISLTFASGNDDPDQNNRDDEYFVYGKLGYQAHFFKVGKTALSVDFYDGDNIDVNGDDAQVYGFQFVQKLDPLAAEVFLGLRNYVYDRPDRDFDDIFTTLTGARLKF